MFLPSSGGAHLRTIWDRKLVGDDGASGLESDHYVHIQYPKGTKDSSLPETNEILFVVSVYSRDFAIQGAQPTTAR